MTYFKELVWKEDESMTKYAHDRHARGRYHFPNGYGASVITGSMFYTDKDHPYELGVLHNDRLCYDTPITSDVIGHLDATQVEELLEKIAALPPQEGNDDSPQ